MQKERERERERQREGERCIKTSSLKDLRKLERREFLVTEKQHIDSPLFIKIHIDQCCIIAE